MRPLTTRTKLADFLTEEQQASVTANHYFEVVGSDGRRYRIYTTSFQGNVHLLDHRGMVSKQYCAHPRMTPRMGLEAMLIETIVTQKLLIEHDAPYFLRIAY